MKINFERPASPIVDAIYREVFLEGYYGLGMEHIKKIKNPVVVDLGSFIGLTPLYFAQHTGATIYAIEPNPDSFSYLKKNTANFPNIHAIEGGISYRAGIRTMYQSKDTDIPMSFLDKGKEAYNCQMMTLEQLFEKEKITHVDLMKIDVEGCEFEIFGSKTFDTVKDKIDCIIGETHDYNNIPFQVTEALIKKNGFTYQVLPYENLIKYYDLQLPGEEKFKIEYGERTMFISHRI